MIRRLLLRLLGYRVADEEQADDEEEEPEPGGGWPPRLVIPPGAIVTLGSTVATYEDWDGGEVAPDDV